MRWIHQSGISACFRATVCVTKPLGERSLFSSFHGDVRAHLDFYLTLRGGVRDFENDTEIYKQAVENAVLQTIHDKTLTWWTQSDPVSYSGQYSSAPELTIQVDDGYAQYVPFQFVFEVHIQ
jgi:hypothetical protein